jgi:hypothetical protein
MSILDRARRGSGTGHSRREPLLTTTSSSATVRVSPCSSARSSQVALLAHSQPLGYEVST